MEKRVLVTGGTGFTGSHLVRSLIAEGWQVHVLLKKGSSVSSLDEIRGKIVLHVHDMTTRGMIEIVKKARPSMVIHLASLFLAEHEPKDVEPLIDSNVKFGAQLAEAMAVNGVHGLVNVGTSWQHFGNKDYDPVCLYAATKQSFEMILRFYVKARGFKVITLKLFDTYGPNDTRPKLFSALKRALSGEKLMMSPGQQYIDITYIDDVVSAFMTSIKKLETLKSGQMIEYAISSKKPIKLKELVRIYKKCVKKELPIVWGARPYREREVMVPWKKGKTLPGWRPKVSLEEGIRKLVSSYRY